ncbi:hypothetical protein C8J56DRAFT_1158357 [Mycena floridula]|nr:hypothetical protein C8J56DRAFT_1158357 [Mycena floridula]
MASKQLSNLNTTTVTDLNSLPKTASFIRGILIYLRYVPLEASHVIFLMQPERRIEIYLPWTMESNSSLKQLVTQLRRSCRLFWAFSWLEASPEAIGDMDKMGREIQLLHQLVSQKPASIIERGRKWRPDGYVGLRSSAYLRSLSSPLAEAGLKATAHALLIDWATADNRDSSKISLLRLSLHEPSCRGIEANTGKRLRQCAGKCDADKKPSYCSKECQRADWRNHKEFCKPGAASSIVDQSYADAPSWGSGRKAGAIQVAAHPNTGSQLTMSSSTIDPKMLKEIKDGIEAMS